MEKSGEREESRAAALEWISVAVGKIGLRCPRAELRFEVN